MLDLCAAPGGKATQLAAAGAEVVAVEKHPGRARELEENAARLGAALTVVNADALELPAELDGFDRVLVDAPCSGLGVLNSRPDLRWRARPLPELQLDLMRAAAERTRPGGSITYSVCTMTRAENEDVIDALQLPVDDLGAEFPEFRHPRRPSSCSPCRTYTRRRGSSSPACAVRRISPCPGNAGCARSRSNPRFTRVTSFGSASRSTT